MSDAMGSAFAVVATVLLTAPALAQASNFHDEIDLGASVGMDGPAFEAEETDVDMRLAWGQGWLEAGLRVPYIFASAEVEDVGFETDSDGVGDVSVYAKAVRRQFDWLSAGLGLQLTLPAGDEDEGLGAGEVGFQPFASVTLGDERLSLRGHIGYWIFADPEELGGQEDPPESWLFGGGVFSLVHPNLGLRAEVIGQSVRLIGENVDLVYFEPGVEGRLPAGPIDLLLRLNGTIGVTEDAADWGVGGSVVLAWDPLG